MIEEIRLNKYLSEMGICSRREADRLIEAGKVFVDGKVASVGMKVQEGQSVVCEGRQIGFRTGEQGKEMSARPEPVLLAVNKPKGVVCTTSDKDRAMNLVDLVNYPERVYPAGRLDKDSEGLIFLTNQGELVNQMMRGSHGHEKEYIVKVDRTVTGEFVKKMERGVWLEELKVMTKPCKIMVTGEKEFHMILTQGLNRQIRRMCETFGYHVLSLQRIRIMNVCLGNLKTGTFRKVTGEEYRILTEMLRETMS